MVYFVNLPIMKPVEHVFVKLGSWQRLNISWMRSNIAFFNVILAQLMWLISLVMLLYHLSLNDCTTAIVGIIYFLYIFEVLHLVYHDLVFDKKIVS